MKPLTVKIFDLTLAFSLLFYLSLTCQTPRPPKTPLLPVPITYCTDTVFSDNYRWLENLNDSVVKLWFKQQGNYFDYLLSQIPQRDSLLEEMKMLDRLQRESISDIQLKNDCYFFLKNMPGEGFTKLYMRIGKDGIDRLLFDPTIYIKDRAYAITFYCPSEDGLKLVIGIAEGGKEAARIVILDVVTKKLSEETIYPCRYAVRAWATDNASFYYTAHSNKDYKTKEFGLDTKLMIHRIGTNPDADKEIFSRMHNPEIEISPADIILGSFSEDRKYFYITLSSVEHNKNIYYTSASSLAHQHISWKHLFSRNDHVTDFVFSNDSIYLITHKDAPNYKLLVTSARSPDLVNAKTLLPEDTNIIKSISVSKSSLFIQKTTGSRLFVLQYDLLTGTTHEVLPPDKGSLEIQTLSTQTDNCILTLESCTRPDVLYDFNSATHQIIKSLFNCSIEYPYIESMKEREVEVTGHDGEKIPLTIIYPKGMKLDSSSYGVMEVYGAYGFATIPYFGIQRLMLIHHGVFYAFAHIRGGGEKGETWHKAGMKKNKSNGWKDAISCAEYLIANKYTSSRKLTIMGTSAGGIVAGMAITTRPDLFGAAITNAGNLNPLLRGFQPGGPANIPEFGDIKDPSECKALIAMDPLYHIRNGVSYPAIISMVGMNDPRIAPWSQAKFIGAIQNSSSSSQPAMLRVSYNTGHLIDDKNEYYKEVADRYSFVLWAMGHPDFQIRK